MSSTNLVPWKERLQQLAKQTEEAEKPTGNFLTFKNGMLLFNDTPVPGNKMLAVPIDYMFENAYFPNRYDPTKVVSPVCYAFARKEAELAPYKDCEDPQHETCDGCERNEWGSDPDGGKGKACKNTRRIALLHKDSLADEKTILEAAVAICKLPVTSVKNWSTFANQCATVLKVPPLAVICEISVVPDPKTQFQVLFKGTEVIKNEDILATLVAKQEMVAKNMIVPYPKNKEEPQKQQTPKKQTKYS